MSAHDLLKHLKVTSPCSADWNSMIGNDRVRFCEHCSLKVHNVSEMTPIEAARLVARSKGRLCVRYYSDSAGDVITRSSARLHQIGRRVSRIAAGAFTATLSLSSAVSHPSFETPSNPSYIAPSQQQGARRSGGTLVGTITDPNGALVPLAVVSLVGADTRVGLATSTNEAGEFTFLQLTAGLYKLRIEAPGFEPVEIDNLYIEASGEIRIDRTLSVSSIVEEVEVRSQFITVTSGGIGLPSPEDPLVRAAQEDNLENVESLIAGADVNLRDKRSNTTALEHAVINGNREMVQLLLSRGADVNAKNSVGQTVLMMLDDEATSDLVWDLINAGAKVNDKDEGGETALISLASNNNPDALKALIEAGALVDARNDEGQTALMRAASENLINNVRPLVLAGSDLNARDKEGKTAYGYALEREHKVVLRFLRSHGALETVAKAKDEEAENEEVPEE